MKSVVEFYWTDESDYFRTKHKYNEKELHNWVNIYARDIPQKITVLREIKIIDLDRRPTPEEKILMIQGNLPSVGDCLIEATLNGGTFSFWYATKKTKNSAKQGIIVDKNMNQILPRNTGKMPVALIKFLKKTTEKVY